jgi:hypothetical protein
MKNELTGSKRQAAFQAAGPAESESAGKIACLTEFARPMTHRVQAAQKGLSANQWSLADESWLAAMAGTLSRPILQARLPTGSEDRPLRSAFRNLIATNRF